jgi:hypothetical protein
MQASRSVEAAATNFAPRCLLLTQADMADGHNEHAVTHGADFFGKLVSLIAPASRGSDEDDQLEGLDLMSPSLITLESNAANLYRPAASLCSTYALMNPSDHRSVTGA